MIISINLKYYFGLSELMIASEQNKGNICLNGLACLSRKDAEFSAGIFEAVSADFHFAAVFPGWYSCNCSTSPVSVFADGELGMLFHWLPIAQANKVAIIQHLPVSEDDKVLLRLAV
ncbi:hypothetical protein [Novosphingobium sp.]|uniref:hypothetical protein n=1 Tax=Novosphingobium sp. TaxID=1874826 RepID=UPI003BAC630F